jgi:hypothetical protein
MGGAEAPLPDCYSCPFRPMAEMGKFFIAAIEFDKEGNRVLVKIT